MRFIQIDSLPYFWKSLIRPSPWPKNSFALPKFQSHRGYHAEGAQENTLASLTEAFERGAQMCEFDVQLTAEHIPVLFHDADLTNFTTEKKPLSAFSLNELRARFPITTLQEALDSPSVPKYFNIELKTNQIDGFLSQQVANLIEKQNPIGESCFQASIPLHCF
jgi:glycerophosphoryl diester phosphodiesterase